MAVPDRPAYHLYQWLWSGLDWLYPPQCGGCGRVGARWCKDCQSKLTYISFPICNTCGCPVVRPGYCRACRKHPPHFSALRSWAVFGGPLRNALHRLKYKRDIALGEVMSRPLIEILARLNWQVDAVVPVPLSQKRQAERGYNQAGLLARPIALASGLPYRPGWIYKSRETSSQVGLSVQQRKDNVAGVFVSVPQNVNGKTILVIDDVATSGATLDSCAISLIEAGAHQVYCLTLARAL